VTDEMTVSSSTLVLKEVA